MASPLLRLTSRVTTSIVSPIGQDAALVSPVLMQRRFKAAGIPVKKRQTLKRSKGDESKKTKYHRPKMENPPATFSPLPANSLRHELFQSGQREAQNFPPLVAKNIQEEMIGKPVQYSDDKTRPYKVFGVPRKMLLEHRLMSKAGSVVRDITVNVARALDEAAGMSSEATRVVLTGRPGCGKSVTLLQSVEYAKSQDWIVLYIPRGIELVNSSSNHVYDLRTRTYLQPYASKQLLMRLITANASALSSLKTTEKHDLTPLAGGVGKEVSVVEVGEPLVKLAEVGTRDFMRYGAVVLEKVMWELGQQEQFPVLLAVDEFQAMYCKTQYRDPNFAGISSYHLSVPRMLMEFASGKRTFKRGALLTALSSSPQYITPLELEDALALPNRLPPSPYYKRSATLASYAEGLINLPVPERLSVEEAAGVYGVWNKDKAILPDSLHDENFLAKYSEASGNARDFVWKGFLTSLQS